MAFLAEHSLFFEGVAIRLRKHFPQIELQVFNPRQPDALAKIAIYKPMAIILDASNPVNTATYPLCSLAMDIPGLRILRLNPQEKEFQLLISQEHAIEEIRELFQFIPQGFTESLKNRNQPPLR